MSATQLELPGLPDGDPEPEPTDPRVPRLLDGTRLLGPFQGSGFRDDRYLVRRADGQTILMSSLLYLVTTQIDGRRDVEAVAQAVSVASGRRLTVPHLRLLLDNKLLPLGIAGFGEPRAAADRADPILALGGRCVLVPPRVVYALAGALAPLFSPLAVLVWLTAFAAFEVWAFASIGAVGESLSRVLLEPGYLLAFLGLIVASMLFHELGHAAACRYGGGRPGAIGAGLYLMLPAFYTNVTDAYRLPRRARVRTDLGGIYFNAVFIVILGGVLAATGAPLLLAVIVTSTFQMVEQLLPFVRFDGYYLLCDLAGVPDLFNRVSPTLRGVLSARRKGALGDLRPRVQRVVTAWVAVVIPLLAVGAIGLLVWLPERIQLAISAISTRWHKLVDAVKQPDLIESALLVVTLALTVLPLLGLAYLAERLLRRAFVALRRAVSRRRRHGTARNPTLAPPTTKPPEVPMQPALPDHNAAHAGWAPPLATASAVAFTEEAMLRPRARPPGHGWRRVLYAATGGAVNVGPSRAELERRDLVARAKAPVQGSRRVVVLCRKGGAGKTSTTLMLGHTFATHRGDRVVALDANPDAGSLAHRVRRETSETVTSMLTDRAALDRYADIRGYTSQAPTRLEVIASDDDPRISQRLGEHEYHQAISLLDHHYNLILVDTGTGILDAAIRGVLLEADQIVVVMPPALDGARVAAATLDWLDEHGYGELVQSAVAVINAVHKQAFVELDRVEEHFAHRCSAVIRVPWDPALAAGATTNLDDLKPATQLAYLKLAAAVSDQFRSTSPRE